jgi:hypothetical protein
MKYCPKCQTSYTDDGLKFCLQDGMPLDEFPDQSSPTVAFDTDSETIVSPKRVEPIRFEPPSSYQNDWQPSQPAIVQPAAKKSNTTAIVLLTALGTILLLGLGGIGAWLYFSKPKTEVAVNVNTAPANRPVNSNAANSQTSSGNLFAPAPTQTATATPQPALKPEQVKALTNDVENVVNQWESTSENLDLDGHLSQYANTVDYYKGGRIGIGKVRADKQRAYDQYDSINFNITNLKVTPDATGEKATAVFDKEWTFEGADKYSAGKVQQQLTLNKISGKWRITGEKDLKIYYVE